jgi:hypothetical protein
MVSGIEEKVVFKIFEAPLIPIIPRPRTPLLDAIGEKIKELQREMAVQQEEAIQAFVKEHNCRPNQVVVQQVLGPPFLDLVWGKAEGFTGFDFRIVKLDDSELLEESMSSARL